MQEVWGKNYYAWGTQAVWVVILLTEQEYMVGLPVPSRIPEATPYVVNITEFEQFFKPDILTCSTFCPLFFCSLPVHATSMPSFANIVIFPKFMACLTTSSNRDKR